MKKFYMIALMAVASMTAYAQQNIKEEYLEEFLQFIQPENVKARLLEQRVIAFRYLVHRHDRDTWEEVRFAGVRHPEDRKDRLVHAVGACFVDVDRETRKYYTGENGTKQIKKLATIENAPSALSFTTNRGETVTMAGANMHVKGVGYYGILAVDNAEAQFVQVDETKSGFYATRCYVQLGSDNNRKITTNHLGAGEVSSIQMVANSSETVDVYNLSGVKVARNLRASEVNKLNPGIYVVKGQKITVK